MTFIELQGSEKQVAWAEKIRQPILDAILASSEYNPELSAIADCVQWLGEIKSAKFWIEHRDVSGSAFLGYAYRKLNKLVDGKMPVYYQRQSVKTNGVETDSKLVPMKFGFVGLKSGANPPKLIKLLHKVEVHEKEQNGQMDVALLINPEGATRRQIILASDSEDGRNTTITPLTELLPGGWGVRDVDFVVVAMYLQCDRIGGQNKAYVFDQIK